MFEAEPGLIIWTWLCFGVLLALLSKFAYKPIVAFLDSRAASIQEELEGSEAKRKEAEDLLVKYKTQLDEGRLEVQKMIEEGRAVGEKLKREIVDKAADESKGLVKKAQEEIDREKKKALMELQEQVAELSVQVASKMIQDTLQPKDHEKLIEDALAQVKENYAKA
ncbi:MAG: F0F1 ATP synthase subunit B [Nitrospirae bacterium]|nr:F0F1 ATP synthase subunit B [Candidatus Manganitrophaceae bacterium]